MVLQMRGMAECLLGVPLITAILVLLVGLAAKLTLGD